MTKKYVVLATILLCLCAACRKQTEYDRNDPNQDYERFINSHVFAACEDRVDLGCYFENQPRR